MNREVFKPVRGTEASILAQTPQKGFVYFALDTKKIFYSDGESFLPMGGNTGVWYGTMEYAETPEETQIEFDFSPDQIEGNEDAEDGKYNLPNLNDLIFNTPDGCFYRVMEIDSGSSTPVLHCYKLTVSGSGSGSGSGTGGTGSMTVSRIGDQTMNTLYGNECNIQFRFIAKDAAGEDTGSGTAALYVKGILKATFTASQGDNTINVGPYLDIGENSIRLVVSGNIGGTSNITQTKNWTVVATNLTLTWDYDDTKINFADTFDFNWSVSTSLDHTTYIVIDDTYTIPVESHSPIKEKSYTINRQAWHLDHGDHEVKMYSTISINNKEFTSATVTHHIICVDEGRSDTIISIGRSDFEVNQYDTLSIPIIFYNPSSSEGKVSAILREDGVDKDYWNNYNNGVQYLWNYTPINSGEKILSIISGTTEKTLRVQVKDLGLKVIEVPGYDFKFKASDITSNNALRNWSYGTVTPSFSEDFDWINGGLKSEKDKYGYDRNYINIKAGSQMSFNYAPLRNIGSVDGFDIKIVFKVSNCRKYDAEALTVGTANSNIYLKLLANEGIYKSAGSIVKVPYCEDSYLELEVDLWPASNRDSSEPYLMTWLDGVPAGVTTYDYKTDNFDNANANLVIGSNDCDVQIYLIKIYKKHLTNEQHLTNFILDAPNATEIIDRYNRNNILNDNGEISYEELIKKNSDCEVYTYEIPKMTTTKKDKVDGCFYQRFKELTTPLQTAENVQIAVQGTSSAAYGLAAFNFNSTFKSGFNDYSSGNVEPVHIDKWAMDENAIPIDDFNTKVNVASCEGVNNALNQKWYNDIVEHVHTTEYKKKNPKSRHTMQFKGMGVVFVKDLNMTPFDKEKGVNNNVFVDDASSTYQNDPYYKMYSICNMGNIKRNPGVFCDPDNPYDVIMENSDNQSVYQQMTGNLTPEGKLDGFWDGDKFYPPNSDTEVFEWREPPADTWDEIKAATNGTRDMRKEAEEAWTDLVAWFAANNPKNATNEDLSEPETYPSYTFKGYTSRADRFDKNGNLMPVYSTAKDSILKGLTISDYAGTYYKDTEQRRMAKMLSECEDHLIMDEIVFHYLFIERHCLIDNVAKNTFWHTEDLQHWSMIKDYDNDTSDGNDNSGHLTLTYGYEVLDHVNHDPNESFVFNAASSVWLNFINGLLPARTRMYQALDRSDIAAWDANPYLQEFEEWQSAIPERVWIEDYYRKYLRPKRVYGATQFLPMLEGGKKTYQRKQFETYQESYMSSEYYGRKCQNSLVDIRANGSNIIDMRFPIKMYSDCYIRIAAGSGQEPNVRRRYHRGEELDIQLPVTGDANDMTTYFYLANYITSLKNIELLKPKKVDISAASRLREFSMKRVENSIFYVQTEDNALDPNKDYYIEEYVLDENPSQDNLDSNSYYNLVNNKYILSEDSEIVPNKDYYLFNGYILVEEPSINDISSYYEQVISNQNLNLKNASFENNTMLEKLEIVDCPNIQNPLDLSNSTNLKYLNIENSGFTGITIADNAPLETLYLNSPTSLLLSNLSKVSTFNIQGYDKLVGLYLKNIDDSPALNSKALIENTNSGIGYSLQEVKWTINDNSEVSDTNIDILDNLLLKTPRDFSSRMELSKRDSALTGTLTITSAAYSGENSLELYNKYSIEEETNYPNLDINFEDVNSHLYNIKVLDGNGNEVWNKKAKAGYSLTNEFFSDSPKGDLANIINDITTKASTASQTFTFADKWLINGSIEINATDKKPIDSTVFSEDIIITPVFIEQVRTYEVKFMNGEEIIQSNTYDYGTKINLILPDILPQKDDSDLEVYETYAFLGYALVPNATIGLKFTDDYIVNSDLTYYAVFTDAIDVKDNKNIHPEYFKFTLINDGFTDYVEPAFNIPVGYLISPKEGKTLYGKITIPAFYEDIPVIAVGGFGLNSSSNNNVQHNITGIFFAENNMIRRFDGNAFANMRDLQYVEFPKNLRNIGAYCFVNSSIKFLKRGQSKNSTLYTIGNDSLYKVDTYSFQNCIHEDCTDLYISSSIGNYGIDSIANFNRAVNLKTIYIGSQDSGSKLTVSENHFLRMNTDQPPLENIYLYLPRSVSNTTPYTSWIDPYYHAENSKTINISVSLASQ